MEDRQIELLKKLLDEHLTRHEERIYESRIHTNEIIEETIRRTVNGKIDAINAKLDGFIVRANPVMDFYDNLTWGKKFILGIAGFIAAIGIIVKFLFPFFNR